MPTPNGKKRVLRPAVFNAIKSQAEKHGGIGSGRMFVVPSREPLCGVGCAYAGGAVPLTEQELTAVRETFSRYTPEEVLAEALGRATGEDIRLGFSWLDSDRAVSDVRFELGLGWNDRVPFEQWAQELNIVRGVELPWAVYDALKASAEKYGGIGYRVVADRCNAETFVLKPCCVLGHAGKLDVGYPTWVSEYFELRPDQSRAATTALEKAFETDRVGDVNDRALERINRRKGEPDNVRVTFEEWADELNVVRGAE